MPRPREDKSVRLSMTGEEFKTLIEQFTDNGHVDTVPELMREAESMSEMKEKVDQMADEILNTAEDSDIESLFGDVQHQQPVINDSDGDGIDDDDVADDDDIKNLFH